MLPEGHPCLPIIWSLLQGPDMTKKAHGIRLLNVCSQSERHPRSKELHKNCLAQLDGSSVYFSAEDPDLFQAKLFHARRV